MNRDNEFLIIVKKIFLAVITALFVVASIPVVEQVGEGGILWAQAEMLVEQDVVNEEPLPTRITYITADVEENEEQSEEEATEEEEEVAGEETEPEYTVTELTAVKYANQASNVRSGPSTDYERIGSLALNQEVQITGQASTGWYRISYNGGEGFVSHTLLVDAPIVIEVPQAEPQPQPQVEVQPQQEQHKQLWEYTEEELVQGIVSAIITPEMDAFQRATVINNYLCNTITYDNTFTHCSTFDALAYGTGVCQGYANAFCRLMNAAGVPTDYVRGYGWSGSEWGRHGWNRSLINGVYYYTDVTWNDSTGSNKYLLISFEEMEKNHREQSINPNRIK